MSQALADDLVMSHSSQPQVSSARCEPVPRWLHAWAIATVCAALPLLLLGAQVTTLGAGMVDSQSVRTPWHIFTVSFSLENFAYLIEHSHRFFGWVVGAGSIVLSVALWRPGGQSRVRWLGWLALFMVSVQGILGIVRVQYNALAGREFALVHGLFAQLAFASLVSAAVVTSPAWQRRASTHSGEFRSAGVALGLVVYSQIVFGAVVRHLLDGTAQRFHVLFAFAVATTVVWVFLRVRGSYAANRALVRLSWLLAGLVALQVILGVEAWMNRFGTGMPAEMVQITPGRMFVRTAHYLVGAFLFSASVAFGLWTWQPVPTVLPVASSMSREGAA